MTAPAVTRGTKAPAPRPVASLDDILLELIDIDDNVRDDVGSLEELQASIAELGLLSPVKVTAQPDGRFRLVYGQRRVLACRALGRLKISAIVEPASDVDSAGARRSIEQLAENLQRKDLNPIEEAVALREVLDADPKLTQEALADQLAMSRPWVSSALGLLKAAPFVQEAVRTGTLTSAHAKALQGLPTEKAAELAEQAVKNGSSAHDLERNAKWAREDLNRVERDRARLTAIGKSAVKALEKVAAKDALIVVDASQVRAVIREAGWTNIHKGRSFDADIVAKAGACGCSTWRIDYDTYGSGKEAKVRPACADPEHRAAREAASDAERQRQRDERDAVEAGLKATAAGDTAAMVAGLPPILATLPVGVRRGLLWIIAGDHTRMLELQKRHGGSADPTSPADFWPTIAALTDEEVLDELAIAIASRGRRGRVVCVERRGRQGDPRRGVWRHDRGAGEEGPEGGAVTAIRIHVTAEDIAACAVVPDVGEGFQSSHPQRKDPIELAIERTTGQPVFIDGEGAEGGNDRLEIATMGQNSTTLVNDLPPATVGFIDRYYKGEAVEPFEFDIELEEWLVALVARAASIDDQAIAVLNTESRE